MRPVVAVLMVWVSLWCGIFPVRAQNAVLATTLSEDFGKHPYAGGYVWRTGISGSYHHPRKVLDGACASTGGSLRQVLPLEQGAQAYLIAGSRLITIDPADLWHLSELVFEAYSRENEVSQTSFVISYPRPVWAPTEAFGLFGCYGSGNTRPDWLVSVMVHHPKLVIIREVSLDMLAEAEFRRQAEKSAERQRIRRAERLEDEKLLNALIEQSKEKERLAPWQQGLKVGDRTNCGMVIETRGPILKVQLPPGYRSPSGDGEFWVRRDDVTDAAPINGCRFGQ